MSSFFNVSKALTKIKVLGVGTEISAFKPKSTLFKTLAAITAIGILIGFTPKIVNEIKRQNFVSEVADEVTDNIIYNVNGTWDYRPTWIIAKGVLDTNKNIDIDTRIYSCYERLNH